MKNKEDFQARLAGTICFNLGHFLDIGYSMPQQIIVLKRLSSELALSFDKTFI